MAKNTASIPAKSTGSNYTAAEFETLRGFVDAPLQNTLSFTPNFAADGQKVFNDYTLSGNETWNASGLQKGNRLMFSLITPGGYTITKGTNLANDFDGLFGSVLPAGTYSIYMNVVSSTEIDFFVPDIKNKSWNGQVKGGDATVAFSATKTFSMDDGNIQSMPVTANITSLAISNEVNGSAYWIVLKIGGSGSYTIPEAAASFGTRTDNSIDDSAADWWPITVGSKIIYTIGVETNGETFYSIETITI